MKKIDFYIGEHSPSVTINLRTKTEEGDFVNAYLSDARERNFNFREVRDNLADSKSKILKSINNSGSLIIFNDLQVLGHSITNKDFSEYTSFIGGLLSSVSSIEKEHKDQLKVLVDTGGLNAHTNSQIINLYREIWRNAPILGCNESEASRLNEALNEELESPVQSASNLVQKGNRNVWMHTRDYQIFFSKSIDNPSQIAKALLFSNLTAGLSISDNNSVTLGYLNEKIKERKFRFREDFYYVNSCRGITRVRVPSLDVKTNYEIQAGDRAGIGLLYGLMKS